MKVVYLAGKYRSGTEYGVHCNIRAAESFAIEIWKLGVACICPHKNTAYLGGAVDDQVFLDGDFELIKRSDAIFMMQGWEDSEGASAELEFALVQGKRLFDSFDKLREWVIGSDVGNKT